MIVNYAKKPKTFESLGNQNLFNYDIQEVSVNTIDNNVIKTYNANQVSFYGEPTYNKLVKLVIDDNYTIDQQISLINKYNSYKFGIIDDNSIENEYKNYLEFVLKTKQMVKNILK